MANATPRRVAELLGSVIERESVLCLEDLMLGRLDWGLESMDHERDIETLADLLVTVNTSLPTDPSALLARDGEPKSAGITRGEER